MKFLFYISKKYSIPIIEPLAKYLTDTKHEYRSYVSNKVKKNLPSNLFEEPVYVNLQEAVDYHPDFVLVPGNFVDFRIPGSKIQIFHGLGVEKAAHYKIRHFFDCYCTSGPFVTRRFKALKKKYKYFRVIETGWPKIDHILNFPIDNLRDNYNLPSEKKVILFAPTHSSKMQSATELMDTIPDIIRKDEFLIVKFHELMDKTIIAEFREKLPVNSLIINDYDITPFLHLADVLISDTSSVLYEFMVLDKPVITYKTQSRQNKGINITDPVILRDMLDWSLKNPKAHSSQRREHLQDINPYLDGKISQRLIETLIQNKSELDKVKKPMNLFRKSQILYHEKFKKGYLR